MASIFAQHLSHLLKTSDKYTLSSPPAAVAGQGSYPQSYRFAKVRHGQQDDAGVLTLRIHTPQFYRQLTTYGKLSDLLSYALLAPYEENRTAWSDDARRLVDTIQGLEPAFGQESRRCMLGDAMWSLYGRFSRAQTLRGSYPSPGLPAARAGAKGRDDAARLEAVQRGCFLDRFVRDSYGLRLQGRYMMATLGLRWRAWVTKHVGGE